MAETSTIEWTDATWNPITGCSVVSPGCTNCYAMRLAGTRLKRHPSRAGLTRDTRAGPVWTGEVRLNAGWLTQPLEWRRPLKIFVCAHGDLFHEAVPDAWIGRVFAVMALAPQHTFQVLTKRSARMRAYLTDPEVTVRIGRAQSALDPEATCYENVGQDADWPLSNVWLGVSAEDQRRADERVPDLLATPAAVRFISAEPLLGAMDLSYWIEHVDHCGACGAASGPQENDRCPACGAENILVSTWDEQQAERLRTGERYDEVSSAGRADMDGSDPSIDWAIVGGESGPDARPMHPDWARAIRDQCAAAGVPFLFKQWGTWKPICAMTEAETDALYVSKVRARAGEDQDALNDVYGRRCTVPETAIGYGGAVGLDAFISVDGHGGMSMYGVGKKAADRQLDGVQHDGMPEARRG